MAGPRLRPWAKKWKETFSTKIDSNSVLLHFQGLLLLLNIKLVDFQNIFFQNFSQVPACGLEAKKWKETFSTKIDSNSVRLAFSGPAFANEHKIGGFSKYIFFRLFHRSAPAALRPKNEMKLFQPKSIRILFVLHFQGLLLLLNIKLVDFQNIFFSDCFAGPRLLPRAKKWNETFSAKIDWSAGLFAFSGPAFANEHKICGFSIFFSELFAGPCLQPWKKMKWNFFSQNRFECCSFAFSGPAVAIEHKIGGFSKYIFFRFFHRSAPAALSQKMKWNFFNQNRFQFCSLAFSGPAVAIEHKIGGFSKYIFFRTFSQVRTCGLEPKNEMKLFQPKSIRILSSWIFRACCCYWTKNLWIFKIYFFQIFSQVRTCDLRPKNEMKFFQPNIDSNAFRLHFQGLLLLMNIKLVDFQNIFFSDFSQVRACGLEGQKMKWNFFSQNRFECCSFAFSGPAVAIEHKICGFSKYIFFRTFCRSAPAALSQKMKGNFFNQNRFEFCSLAFSGPAVAIEHKIGGFSKYIFFRFFRRSAPAA